MTFPDLSRFLPIALLLMRLMVGAIFITSGWSHVSRAEERAKSIELSKGFTHWYRSAPGLRSADIIVRGRPG